MENEKNNYDLSSLRIDRSKKFNDRPKSRIWLWGGLAVIGAATVLAYFSLRESVTPAQSVQIASVTRMTGSDAAAELVATGYVVAQRLAEVASKGTGRLAFIGFDEGDVVVKGEVIARLENEDIKANLDLARARLAQATVDTLNLGRQYRRQVALRDSGAVTQEMMESAESAYLGSLAAAKAAEATVRIAEVDLENTIIRAPFDGTVLTKNAEVGEIVAPFASSASSKGSVVTLADMTSLEVEADVNESNINKVIPNQRCEIVLDAYPSVRYKGYVKKIVPTADRSRATVLTRVAFAEIDDRVLPEMSARVNFFVENGGPDAQATALTVPDEAVTSRDGKTVVFRIVNDVVSEVTVETGRDLGSRTEILSGLGEGDRVVLSPPGKLTDGQKITESP
ncbi:MAG: efflux RND transporter periplasmic adaptor subunit [candidate division Zixibacteria bacterium]|jgi:RND family efflux transporter MFP subunit|nr:efflux RND transporter periplasmic adaptor subunit [candidate division Zixibacteria bacterium]